MNRPKLKSKRTAAVAALAAVLVVGAVIVIATGSSDDGSKKRAASTSTTTTQIKRQDLVESDSEDGTLGYADTRSVINRLSGTITWLPAQGAVISADHALYKVDDKPVILMTGHVPVYRTLSAGISDGADVHQLESTLRATGYDPSGAMIVNDHWSTATTAAVERWQHAHDLPQTGTVALGRIVFLPGSRRIASMSVTLGGPTSGGGGGGTSTVSASAAQLAAQAGNGGQLAYVSSTDLAQAPTTPTTPTTTPTPPTTTSATPPTTTGPGINTTPSKTKPSHKPTTTTTTPAPATTTPAQSPSPSGAGGSGGGGSSSGSGGGGSSVANAIMTTTSTRRVVTVAMDTTKSSLAKDGARVSVQLPSGDDVDGRISSVGKVATSTASSDSSGGGGGGGGGSSDSGATINVTIHLSEIHTNLDQAPVTVSFEQERRRDVLAIPVTALLAQPGGRFAVDVVQNGGAHRIVPVQTGLYTSGFVEIEGQGLQPGMRVTNAAV